MAAEVQPLQRVKLPTGPSAITPEQKYWNSFTNDLQLSAPNNTAITSISFPPPPTRISASPPAETFAVTSGPRVQIFSSKTRQLVKTISRFSAEDVAHSGTIRRDGRILVAGGETGAIQTFDISSRAILKTWKEHKQPVWVTKWHPDELTTLMSASDDTTVRIWDLPSDASTHTFYGHDDYVRSGAFMPKQASGLVVSGSYDQTVRLWDPRTPGKEVMIFNMGSMVEAVLPMPSATTVLAAGGNQIAVLDLVGARTQELLENHQKTVTCLALANDGTRVLSGGLDGHVKVFETAAWNVVAGFKYPSPVLSLSVISSGAAREDRHLAVGMESGLLSVKTRLSGKQKALAKEREKEMAALMDGKIDEYDKKSLKRKRGKGWEKRLRGKDYTGEGADIIIKGNDRGKIKNFANWELSLQAGKYETALDQVLESKSPNSLQDTTTLLTTLRHRSALRTALSNRDELTLQPILRWINTTLITQPRLVTLASDVILLVLDLYAEYLAQSPDTQQLFTDLCTAVRNGLEASQVANRVAGMVDMLVNGHV
ncbi:WD40 repeat-like protein [Lophium mytilinum]|uniref:WD40 repeat-like protein n=1 Tax=Lophium mytilinum TaxID=390894 RepID=A0A6A6QME4_9PEZI|nr:WD40 repeat-like protein [Lophium mytilinum]